MKSNVNSQITFDIQLGMDILINMDFILDIRIWRQGTNAYWAGQAITTCPYEYGTNEFYSWTDGFESAIIPPDDETE